MCIRDSGKGTGCRPHPAVHWKNLLPLYGYLPFSAWEYIFPHPAPQALPDKPPDPLFSVPALLFLPEKGFPDEPEAFLPELFPYGQQGL